MGLLLKMFILVCGLFFSGLLIRLLLQRKINARNSVTWLTSAIIILVLSANPRWLDWIARAVGIEYPPALLFLLSTLILLVISLYHSMQISVLNEKLRQLAQHVALEEQKRYDSNIRNMQ